MIFSRRYALTSGFYPTAYGKTGTASWKSHSYGHTSGLLKVQGVDWDGKPNFNRTYPRRRWNNTHSWQDSKRIGDAL